jgi:hypothetical protein
VPRRCAGISAFVYYTPLVAFAMWKFVGHVLDGGLDCHSDVFRFACFAGARRITKCIEAFENGDFPNFKKAAAHFCTVPSHMLQVQRCTQLGWTRSIPRQFHRVSRTGTPQLRQAKRCDASGFCAFPSMIHSAATVILNAGLKPPLLPPPRPRLGYMMA